MIRVSSEFYDKAWYVNTNDTGRAIELVVKLTEKLGWHKQYPEEKRDWDAHLLFTKHEEILEDRDI